jgi:hypothetical protein
MKRSMPRERNPRIKVQVFSLHTGEKAEWDLNLLEKRVNRDVHRSSEKVTETFLEEDNRNLGDGIGDPASG